MRTSFPKALRLLSSRDFQAVFERSRRAKCTANARGFRLVICPKIADKPRLGFIISKKNVSKAVVRNRIKRVIRESFRLNQHLLKHDVIVIAHKEASSREVHQIRENMAESWRKLSSGNKVRNPARV